MRTIELEQIMRERELFHHLKAPEGFIVIRVDGRAFSTFTNQRFEKPFDPRFKDIMRASCESVMQSFDQTLSTYTESDEASFLLPTNYSMFSRGVEKMASLYAATMSSAFTLNDPDSALVSFDGRVVSLPTESDVVDYFSWRHGDAKRCALNSSVYWELRKTTSGAKADSLLKTVLRTNESKQKFLKEIGILDGLEDHAGENIFWKTEKREGFNPQTQETVEVYRRVLKVSQCSSKSESQRNFVKEILRENRV